MSKTPEAAAAAPLTGPCAFCYEEGPVSPARCRERPELLAGQPLGQYHCPDCGAMVMAGVPHPPLCERCQPTGAATPPEALPAALEALRFYADESAWDRNPSPVIADRGGKAREALQQQWAAAPAQQPDAAALARALVAAAGGPD